MMPTKLVFRQLSLNNLSVTMAILKVGHSSKNYLFLKVDTFKAAVFLKEIYSPLPCALFLNMLMFLN